MSEEIDWANVILGLKKKMSEEIDWAKILDAPEKTHKIPGNVILGFRNRTEKQKREIEELTKNNSSLKTQVDGLEKRNSLLISQIEQLKKDSEKSLEEIRNKHSNDLNVKNRELNAKNDEITELNTFISELQKKISELETSITSLEEDISEFKRQNTAKDEALDSLKTDLNNKISDLERMENELTEKDSRIKTQQNELELKLSEKGAEAENIISERTTEYEKKLEDSKAAYEKEKNALNEISLKKEEEISQLKEKISELTQTISDKDTTISEKEEAIKTLNQSIKELKDQIPEKPIYEKADELVKGAACPNCGVLVWEEYRYIEGKKELIRKYCPNTNCGWSYIDKPDLIITLEGDAPPEKKKELKIFQVVQEDIKEVTEMSSEMVAIVSDPKNNVIWIWKGKDSSRFEYSEATRLASRIKNDIAKLPTARIERIEEGAEPTNFPLINKK